MIGVILELYFAGQRAQRILWPMTASAVRCVFALVAMVMVLQGYASLHSALVLVAVSLVVAATISLLGFLRTGCDR